MATEFSRTLSLLRKERGVSQRVAAADLGVSQALLSHYENGRALPLCPRSATTIMSPQTICWAGRWHGTAVC